MKNIVKYSLFSGFLILIFSINFLIYCKNENKNTAVKVLSAKDSTDNNKEQNKLKDLKDVFKLHYDAFVIDTHNDLLYQVFNKDAAFKSIDRSTQSGLERFKEGGVDLQVFAVWIPGSEEKRAFNFANEQILRLKNFEKEHNDEFGIAYCYDDAIRIHGEGKFCGMLGIEDGAAVMNDVNNVDKLYEAGVRYIGLTWNKNNRIGSSAMSESKQGKGSGLTEFGRIVVARMQQLGILVDISHSGDKTFDDVMEITTKPVIASHSNCYALNPHFRNLKDEQIKAIAKTGGVIMVNFVDDFINENARDYRVANYYKTYRKELDKLKEKYQDIIEYNVERYKFIKEHQINGGTSIDDLINHIDHIKSLVGADYIGIGSDFDGGIVSPNELYDATCYPVISAKLWEKGYTEEEIRKILGGNFLRVLKQVCNK